MFWDVTLLEQTQQMLTATVDNGVVGIQIIPKTYAFREKKITVQIMVPYNIKNIISRITPMPFDEIRRFRVYVWELFCFNLLLGFPWNYPFETELWRKFHIKIIIIFFLVLYITVLYLYTNRMKGLNLLFTLWEQNAMIQCTLLWKMNHVH